MTIEPVVDDTSDLDGPAPRGIIPFGPPAPPPPPTPLVQPKSEYDMPLDCMHGWLGEQTMKLETPPGIGYCSMLAIFSGQGIPMDKRTGTRGQIYVVITASPAKGKSHTMTRAKRSLIVRPGVIRSANPGSDIGLQHILALEPEEGAPKGTPQPVNYCLLHADELKGLIGRLSIQNSGLGTMLTDMWDNDIYETDRKS